MQANSGFLRIVLAVLLTAGVPSCRTLEKKGEETDPSATDPAEDASDPSTTTLPIGVVQHVDESARFVLIRSSRTFQIEPETVLMIRGSQGEPLATVKVSPARKGAFLTADIVEGAPKVGQAVTMDYTAVRSQQASSAPVAPPPSDIQVLE